MAGNALDDDVEPLSAGGTNCQLVDGTAIKVEGKLRPAQVGRLHKPGTPEANLFLNGKQ